MLAEVVHIYHLVENRTLSIPFKEVEDETNGFS